MDNWDDAGQAQVADLPEIKLFGKWSSEDVQVSDISLAVSDFALFSILWLKRNLISIKWQVVLLSYSGSLTIVQIRDFILLDSDVF